MSLAHCAHTCPQSPWHMSLDPIGSYEVDSESSQDFIDCENGQEGRKVKY